MIQKISFSLSVSLWVISSLTYTMEQPRPIKSATSHTFQFEIKDIAQRAQELVQRKQANEAVRLALFVSKYKNNLAAIYSDMQYGLADYRKRKNRLSLDSLAAQYENELASISSDMKHQIIGDKQRQVADLRKMIDTVEETLGNELERVGIELIERETLLNKTVAELQEKDLQVRKKEDLLNQKRNLIEDLKAATGDLENDLQIRNKEAKESAKKFAEEKTLRDRYQQSCKKLEKEKADAKAESQKRHDDCMQWIKWWEEKKDKVNELEALIKKLDALIDSHEKELLNREIAVATWVARWNRDTCTGVQLAKGFVKTAAFIATLGGAGALYAVKGEERSDIDFTYLLKHNKAEVLKK